MSETEVLDAAVTITAETSFVDPDSCRFTVNRIVHPGGPYAFDARQRSGGSPLVERMFALPGVAHVIVADAVVVVGKDAGASWADLKLAIGAAIRAHLLSGFPAIIEAPDATSGRERTDEELRAAVQELLDKEVNRSIASHGGQISITDVRDKVLFISMGGGCQGCASSTATLQQGIEVMVRRVAPEIVQIVDVTDHASGQTPYYPTQNGPSGPVPVTVLGRRPGRA